jgi:hypothetical protein
MPDDAPAPAAASSPANRTRPNRTRKLVRKRERLAEAILRADPKATNATVLAEVRAKSDGVGVSLETLAALRERFRPRPAPPARRVRRAQARANSAPAPVAPVAPVAPDEPLRYRGGYVEDAAGDRWWSQALLAKVEGERDRAVAAHQSHVLNTPLGALRVAALVRQAQSTFAGLTRLTVTVGEDGRYTLEVAQAGTVAP